MKAIVYMRYGGPEVLEYSELEKPVPARGEVLVRVRASSVNAADYRTMRADPFLVRLQNGLSKPRKVSVLGSDVAGVVEDLGEGVTHFSVGDEVFGLTLHDGMGAFAEYAAVSGAVLVPIPAGMSFEEAAALPLAGVTALQAVRDLGGVQSGQSVLVQGAGGGVGTLVVQIAKARGAEVTAVCGEGGVELVSSLGAEHVVDYRKQDFSQEGRRYDVILGVNGYHSLSEYRDCLNPGGRYVMIGGTNRQIFESLLFGRASFMFSGKAASVLTIDHSRRGTDLLQLRELLSDGRIRPVIDRCFALEEVADAVRYVEKGHVRGKVVITVDERRS